MRHWKKLIDATTLAGLLPAEFAYLAAPVRDALCVFLDGLPDAEQQILLAEQARLPWNASLSRRLGRLARRCPVLHKLGQILARDQRLAPELREQLRELESLPPSVPWETIEASLLQELGSLDPWRLELQPPALAEASVAVVVPCVWHDASSPAGPSASRAGVLKLLKPGIEERLTLELQLLERVGEQLDQRCNELGIPALDYQESFQQVRDKLLDEIRLDREQQHLAEARRFYADEPEVQIPELWPACTTRVTAMERVSGYKVTERALTPAARRWLTRLISNALIARPMFSRHRPAPFHGDPHAGNMFLTDDHRLAILDWSLVGRLEESDRVAVVQILLAAALLDARRIVQLLEGLAVRPGLDREKLQLLVRDALRQVRCGQFPGLTWLTALLDRSVQTARLRLAAELLLFRKSLHTLTGVVAEVGGQAELLDEMVTVEFLRQFAVEWPQRWFALPHSRSFATRLSNLDLTSTILSGPLAVARFWWGHGLDFLTSCPPK